MVAAPIFWKLKNNYMNTLTVETTRSEKRTIELPIPFFARSKNENDWIAVLDEKTVVNIYKGANLTIIKNSTPNYESNMLAEAYETWHSCTETEFLEKYDDVISSISLHPKLAV